MAMLVEDEFQSYKLEDGKPTPERLNKILAAKTQMRALFDFSMPFDSTRLTESDRKIEEKEEEEKDGVHKIVSADAGVETQK